MGKSIASPIIKNKYSSFLRSLLFAFFLFFTQSFEVEARQNIINIPSSEVLPAGSIGLKDSNRYTPNQSEGQFRNTPAITVGTGFGTEFSAGVATTIQEQSIVRGDFTFKKVFFLGSSTRLSVGTTISPCLTGGSSPDTFGFVHVTQRIKKTKTSITAGAYMNGQQQFLNKGGVLLGIDQVLIPNKLRFAMDLISGDDSFGKLGVGLKYRPVPTVSITSAVIIPTNERDNIGLNISVSKFISLKDFEHKEKGRL